jgi:hypothetical protein
MSRERSTMAKQFERANDVTRWLTGALARPNSRCAAAAVDHPRLTRLAKADD